MDRNHHLSLCAAGFPLFFGRVADLFGRRRLFLSGTAVLGLASLVGGLAVSPVMLLLARVFVTARLHALGGETAQTVLTG